MHFKDFIEHIQFDLLLEGLGIVFGLSLLWQLVFRHEIYTLISQFITTIC